MRDDQYEKLCLLSESLADVALIDTDPGNWSGAGKTSRDMTREERGDAYWSRKMAAASLALLQRVVSLTDNIRSKRVSDTAANEEDGLLDKEIAEAEAEAAKMLDRVQREQRKAERVSKSVNGKA